MAIVLSGLIYSKIPINLFIVNWHGFSDIELGDNFSYNTDYANNQSVVDFLHKAGIYSDEAYNAISKMNETHVNSKVTTDNNSLQYSQRFDHGGLESEMTLGKNGE